MTPEDSIDLDEADLIPVVHMIVGGSVDRRGNYTCLAVTTLGAMISLGQVAN